MATYVLIHGASSDAWYWRLVVPELQAHGHEVVAPDLPSDDDDAGLDDYVDAVVNAIADRSDLIVVGQSFAGFTAPMVCALVPARLLVFVAAMVPRSGEFGDEWWMNTSWEQARQAQAQRAGRTIGEAFDSATEFFHDVPPQMAAEAFARGERRQSQTPFHEPWPMTSWPNVPTRFLLGRYDRLFPADFMRRTVRDRLGIVPDEIESGHLPALSHPQELVERLEAYRKDVQ